MGIKQIITTNKYLIIAVIKLCALRMYNKDRT